MRLVGTLAEDHTATQHDRESQRCSTGVNVNCGTTGVVNDARKATEQIAQVHNPAATPHPGSYREVDQGGPHTCKHHPGAKLCPIGNRTGYQRHGDNRKRGAKSGTEQVFVTQTSKPHVHQWVAGKLEGISHCGHVVSIQHPQHSDECECAKAHHHHADNALRLD